MMSDKVSELLSLWPKKIPELSPEQAVAREEFMKGWLELLPKKYGIVEAFNQGWVAQLPLPNRRIKTLEIGAGLGEHASWEDLTNQDYVQNDYREEFCRILSDRFGSDNVLLADVQKPLNLPRASFDRILALHVLEHLPNLVEAVVEIARLMKDDAVFDLVIPCEGGFAYSLARKISAQRYFEKRFKMDYLPIVATEHVNTGQEIAQLLQLFFKVETSSFFPLKIPVFTLNLVYGMRLKRRSRSELASTFEKFPQIFDRIFKDADAAEKSTCSEGVIPQPSCQ